MTKPAASGWLALSGAIGFEVIASLSMKGALQNPVFFAVVALGYIASFTCLGKVLKAGMSLGIAYGIWGAAGVILTAVFSAVLFGESLTLTMWAGIALTIAGVFCIRLGAEAASKKGEAA